MYAARSTPHPNENLLSELIDAAVTCFEESGFQGATVQRICEVAGVTKGAFYHYFNTKEEVLLVIHEMFLDHENQILDDILQREPVEALTLVCEELVALNDTFSPKIAAVAEENRRFLLRENFERARRKRDDFESKIVGLIERGVAEGAFRATGHPRLVAFGVIGMCLSVYKWYGAGGVSAREIGRLYAQVIVAGIATD